MDRLKSKKVFVGKYSRDIHKKAFDLGFKRATGDKEINLNEPFLFFDENGNISFGRDLEYFNNHPFEEVTPEYILSLEVEKKPKWEDFGVVKGYIVQLLKIAEEKGIDYTQIDIPYKPVLR